MPSISRMDEINLDVPIVWKGMSAAIAKEFMSYSFVFTPILVVIAIESRWSLKVSLHLL